MAAKAPTTPKAPLSLQGLFLQYTLTHNRLCDPATPEAEVDRTAGRLERLTRLVQNHPIASLSELSMALYVLAHEECGGGNVREPTQPLACMWRAACALNAKP